MAENTENLKLIIDLASNSGAMQERCVRLADENAKLREENAELKDEISELKQEYARLKATLEAQDRLIAEQTEHIQELEKVASQIPSGGSVVVVNQYFMLSVEKTCEYVTRLDAEHRIFVGHMFQHTLPDNTSKHILDQVRDMTELREETGLGIHVDGDYNDIHDNGEVNT